MVAIELEAAFHDVIMNILSDEEKIEKAKIYFENVLVNDLIETVCDE